MKEGGREGEERERERDRENKHVCETREKMGKRVTRERAF